MGAGLGAGREGVWQALGVRGRAGRRCRQLGARARGALTCEADGARGRQGARAAGAQGGRCAGGRRTGARARGAYAAGLAAGALLGARSSRGTDAVRAAMHSLGVAWCTGWASLGLKQPVWVLTWVFDSVVFLSHRLNSVHEHCSLQKIFPKKIKILNSNKIK